MNNLRWLAFLSTQFGYEGKTSDDTPTATEDLGWLLDLFKKHCPPGEYPQVFNPGCGAGAETRLLKDNGYSPIGFTLGAENVRIGKERYGVTLLESDFHVPGFNDASFDAIFTVQSAEHALSMHVLMLEFWRILRVGGRWFVDTATQNGGMWQVWHPNLHTHDEWVKYGETYGFKVAADESSHDRTDLFLEKVDDHPNLKYTSLIYEKLSKATNGE